MSSEHGASLINRLVQRTLGFRSSSATNDSASATGPASASTPSAATTLLATHSTASLASSSKRRSRGSVDVTSSQHKSSTPLRRTSSVSSLRSAASASKQRIFGGLWKKVTGASLFSAPTTSAGNAAAKREPPNSGRVGEPGEGLTAARPEPQLLYFMGSRPSTTPSASSSSTSLDSTNTQVQRPGGHAKLLSMVAEGDEDAERGGTVRGTLRREQSPVSGVPATTGTSTAGSNTVTFPGDMVIQPTTATHPEGDTVTTAEHTAPFMSRYMDPFASSSPTAAPPNSPDLGGTALPSIHVSFTAQPPPQEGQEDQEEDLTNPTVLARKIQELIDALPAPPVWEHPTPSTLVPDLPPSTPQSPRRGLPGTPGRRTRPRPYPKSPGSPRRHPPMPSIIHLPPPPKPRTPKRDPKTGRPLPPSDAVPILEGGGEVDGRVVEALWGVSRGAKGGAGKPKRGEGGAGGPPSRTIWSILESYATRGHIPPTPYTPGRNIPLPPVDEGEEEGSPGGEVPLPPVEEPNEGNGPPSDNPDDNPPYDDPDSPYEDDPSSDGLFTDGSSVMLYSPILPGGRDIVEMGELVSVFVEEDVPAGYVQDGGPDASKKAAGGWSIPRPPNVWSWFGVMPTARSAEPDSQALSLYGSHQQALSPYVNSQVLSPCGGSQQHKLQDYITASKSPDGRTRYVRIREQKSWAPSLEKMSVQVFWWGYRIFLPPPVLLILSDKTIEAAKRAAMITTALTWFFSNIPVASLPIAIQPTVLLLQRLAPYLGYVGTFISWSWQQIKSYDVGNGVTLTATWLLPIALVPGTWWNHSFPKSPPAKEPVALPDVGPTKPIEGPLKTPPKTIEPAPPNEGSGEAPSHPPPSETEGAPTESTPSSPRTELSPMLSPFGSPLRSATALSADTPPTSGSSTPIAQGRWDSFVAIGASLGAKVGLSGLKATVNAGVEGGAGCGSANPSGGGGAVGEAGVRKRKTSVSATIAAFIGRKELVEGGRAGARASSAASKVTVSADGSGNTSAGLNVKAIESPSTPTPAQASSRLTTRTPPTEVPSGTDKVQDPSPQEPEPPYSPAFSMYATPPTSPVPLAHSALSVPSFSALGVPSPNTDASNAPTSSSAAPVVVRGGVHPNSELGQELVRSWRVGTVPLPEDVRA